MRIGNTKPPQMNLDGVCMDMMKAADVPKPVGMKPAAQPPSDPVNAADAMAKAVNAAFNIPDPVNQPSHYTGGSIECIAAIEASMTTEQFLGFLKGNVMKYMWRYENKSNPKQDLKKADWYLEKMIETLSEQEEDSRWAISPED